MKKQTASQPTVTAQTNQTPFERFQDALSRVVSVPKSSLPKPVKKSKKT